MEFGSRADGGWPKRVFDVVLSVLLLVVLSPLFVLCAAAVFLSDGYPILFRQERVGLHGRLFSIVKFRTMQFGSGTEVTAAGDSRVTRVGRILRKYKLDELPQLWNVLTGEMSLVGPRPEVRVYVALQERAYRAIADLRPGVTDWASIAFRDEEEVLRAHEGTPRFYEEFLLPRKLALSRLYRRRRSFWLDVRLIAGTAFVGVRLYGLASRVAGRRVILGARRLRVRRDPWPPNPAD